MASTLPVNSDVPIPQLTTSLYCVTDSTLDYTSRVTALISQLLEPHGQLKGTIFPSESFGDTKLFDYLTFETESLFETFKTWVETESDTLRPDYYPDVIAALLDCNANTPLLTLTGMLVPVHRARSRSSGPEEEYVVSQSSHDVQYSLTMEDPAVIEYCKQRAVTA